VHLDSQGDGYYEVYGAMAGDHNLTGTTEYEIPNSTGDFPFGETLELNESHSVAVEYDEGTDSLKIEYDGYVNTFDMSTLTAFDPANIKTHESGHELEILK